MSARPGTTPSLLYSAFIVFLCFNFDGMAQVQTTSGSKADHDMKRVKVIIGNRHFTATLVSGPASVAFVERLPLSVEMSELNGNEKHGRLAKDLPTQVTDPERIHAGDLMVWGSNTLVLFYQTFPTTYSYTRLGKVDDPEGLASALGRGEVVVKFEVE